MTFWYQSESGSAYPCLWLMDPDPAIFYFLIDLQDANKKLMYFCLLPVLLEGTFISFFNDKKSKKSHRTVGIRFFLLFLLNDRRPGSGSPPLINGYGSRRPKNKRIRRIRIRNTGFTCCCTLGTVVLLSRAAGTRTWRTSPSSGTSTRRRTGAGSGQRLWPSPSLNRKVSQAAAG
jgi:hypothetical protein